MKNIAILASGGGSNAQKIIEYFEESELAQVSLIISNRSNAGVLDRAKKYNIPSIIISRKEFYENEDILEKLDTYSVDFVVLAGFLWLVPLYLVKKYADRIVNIHPALLPKYGGKGMYGMNVHRAVHEAQEKESGMTIHKVDEQYDEGSIIFQAKCSILPSDSPEAIAKKVLALEHRYYPQVVAQLIRES